MPTEPVKTESSLEEQLVAYLDGELDPESVRRIEERLASEPEVRETLNRLEQTWEMLDELGSTPVGESFTRTTLEMVTLAAEKEVEHVLSEAPVRRRRLAWFSAIGFLAAIAAGFFAVSLALPNPNRDLIAELPLLENYEEYHQINDIQFLRLLKERDEKLLEAGEKALFPKPHKEQAESAAKAYPRLEEMAAAERASWIENQPADKKSDLWRNKKNFDNLIETEQEKLSRLHEEIQKDPNADELRRIMHDYYAWWKDQSPFDRNDLSMMVSPQQRLERVEQLKREEARRNPLKDFPPQDIVVLQEWIEKKIEESRESSAAVKSRKETEPKPEEQRPGDFWRYVAGPRGQGGGPRSQKMPGDIEDLYAKFSPETQLLLEGKTPEEKWKTIQPWLREAGLRLLANRTGGRRMGPRADENELAVFFENLQSDQRSWLLDLPPEDMWRALQRMYYLQKKAKESSFMDRPGGSPPGGRRPFGPPPNSDRERPKMPEKVQDNS